MWPEDARTSRVTRRRSDPAARRPRPGRDEPHAKSGANRDAYYPAGWLIEERTARFLRDVLRTAGYPDYLRHPMYARALQAWARAEVITDVIYAWMDELMSVQGSIAAMMLPPMPGTKALIETWRESPSAAPTRRARHSAWTRRRTRS